MAKFEKITGDIIKTSVTNQFSCNSDDAQIKEFAVSKGSKLGDGFNCDILTVQAVAEVKKKLWNVNYIAKCISDNEFQRNFVTKSRMFETEALMYKEILPNLVKLSQSLERPLCVPECYFSDANAGVIIQDDLKRKNYFMIDKTEGVNSEQIKLILEQLAILHGTSYHFINQIGVETFIEKYDILNTPHWFNDENDEFTQLMEGLISSYNQVFCMAMDEFCDDEHLSKRVKTFEALFHESFRRAHKPVGKFNCIIQNDCWSNNFLFKQNFADVFDVVVLDFQLSRRASPALDLCYFLGSSTTPEYRRVHLGRDLKFYHGILSKTLEHFGYDSFSLYSFDDLKSDFDGAFIHAFTLGHIHTQNALTPSDSDAAFNPKKYRVGEMDRIWQEMRAAQMKHMRQHEVLRSRVLELGKEAAERGVF